MMATVQCFRAHGECVSCDVLHIRLLFITPPSARDGGRKGMSPPQYLAIVAVLPSFPSAPLTRRVLLVWMQTRLAYTGKPEGQSTLGGTYAAAAPASSRFHHLTQGSRASRVSSTE